MLADELDYVIGVDTHRDEHVLAVVAAPAGAVVARRAIEGSGSYGAGLARSLSEQGEAVLEVGRTPRAERRLAGKDDSLDAGPHRAGKRWSATSSRCRAVVSGARRCDCC